ncbi:MAG: hypothetical protein HND42_02390 [Armatimonadetes bacterium]|nr:hypothetical protein [Armatimonadota bacterium]
MKTFFSRTFVSPRASASSCRIARCVVLVVCVAAVAPLFSSSFTWIGTLGGNGSRAAGVSADGRVVVGSSANALGFGRAFRLENGIMTDLGTLGGTSSEAHGVSADGRVIFGTAYDAAGVQWGVAWFDGRIVPLVTLDGRPAAINAVSDDGAAFAGEGDRVAYRWVGTLPQRIGPGNPHFPSSANGLSADGSVVVGQIRFGGGSRAARWGEKGLELLPTLGGTGANATAVSADGSIVVGRSSRFPGDPARPCRWVDGRPEDLGTAGERGGMAYAVSADGRVVVGVLFTSGWVDQAFRWTPERGMENLNRLYMDRLTRYGVLVWARDVSPDGRFIVGTGLLHRNSNLVRGYIIDTQGGP